MGELAFDTIVVGQGLAGTALAWSLFWRGQRVLVIDPNRAGTSSRIAAGLMTPITGKKLVPTWRWDRFWPAATQFYERVETETRSSFFHPLRTVRLLATAHEQQYFEKRQRSEFAGLIDQPETLVNRDLFDDSLGGFEMVSGGRLDVSTYLSASSEYFQQHATVITEELDPRHDLQPTTAGLNIPRLGISGKRLIFCQGINALGNPWFPQMQFKPAKGEILTLKIEGLPEERIVSSGVWLMPLGNDTFRAGATYEWHELNSGPTAAGREEICQRLREFLRLPFEVIAHQAAVRPIMRHLYPVIGLHRDYPQLGFFNGLGSKGALQSPWLADHFAGTLVGEHEIDPTVSARLYDREHASVSMTGTLIETSPERSCVSVTEMAHQVVKAVLQAGDIAIDATAGNGHDTQFLATCVGPCGKVYSFDVQSAAIDATARRLRSIGLNNVTLLHKSHAEMQSALPEAGIGSVSAIMFNLGYLPTGDKMLTTQLESTITAVRSGLILLRHGGIMTILAYVGHSGGMEEAIAVKHLLNELSPSDYEVQEVAANRGRKSAPRLFVLRRMNISQIP